MKVIVNVFINVFVFLLARSSLLITLIKCLKGQKLHKSLFGGANRATRATRATEATRTTRATGATRAAGARRATRARGSTMATDPTRATRGH